MSTDSRIVDGDPSNAPGNLDELETSLRQATTKPDSEKDDKNKAGAEGADKPTRPDWIEEKFWTGDLHESAMKQARSYRDLHSAYGRMANDLGTQRKMTDRLLAMDKRSTDLDDNNGQPKKPRPKIDPRRLVDNPTETLDEYLDARESEMRKQIEEQQRQQTMQQQEQEFVSKYPNYVEVAQSGDFQQWILSSPLRKQAAGMAAAGDYTAASALMDEWNVQSGNLQTKDEQGNNRTATDAELEAARKIATESAAQAGGGGGSSKGPIYRRADLIKLKLEKPDVYSDPKFQEEILAAYAQGRVK